MSVQYVQNSGGFNPLGILGTVASLAIPGAGPWIAGANALGSALSGDWTGAVKNGISAGLGSGKPASQSTPALSTGMESSPNYINQNLSSLNNVLTGSGPNGSTATWSPKDNQLSIANVQPASQSTVNPLSASDQKYSDLLSMYGLNQGGNGKFNADAAKKYYQTYKIGNNALDTKDSPQLYNALMSAYGKPQTAQSSGAVSPDYDELLLQWGLGGTPGYGSRNRNLLYGGI